MSGSIRASTSRAARPDGASPPSSAAASPTSGRTAAPSGRSGSSSRSSSSRSAPSSSPTTGRSSSASRASGASRSSTSTPRPTSAASSQTEAEYAAPEVRCLIRTGGLEACLDDPEGVYAAGGGDGTVDGAADRPARLGALAADPLQLQHHQLRRRDRPLAARPHPLARHRRPDPRRGRAGDLRLPHLGAVRAGGGGDLQPDRHRRRRLPGLLRRLGRPLLPAHRRDSG